MSFFDQATKCIPSYQLYTCTGQSAHREEENYLLVMIIKWVSKNCETDNVLLSEGQQYIKCERNPIHHPKIDNGKIIIIIQNIFKVDFSNFYVFGWNWARNSGALVVRTDWQTEIW